MNKLKMLWMSIKAKCEIIYIPNLQNFLYFQKLAWQSLLGNMTVMSGREVKSKGGFKYRQIEISKLPISSNHNYR